ncbi:MAG: DEAD/DEAH box helicase [Marivivens sp.]|nr:DEAD/DEAH box helicase [Marivivens sp.]NBT49959.1 DEAD/DEAH box helicase [Marivivens sp.]NCW67179.1 DEAD/DEAH box helicase [Marivivens sp.]
METALQHSRFKTKPYAHQLKYITEHSQREAFALLAEMGTGKTWMAINNLSLLWAEGRCNAALVFAPNGVHTNWTDIELGKHMPDWCRWRAYAWNGKKTKAEQAKIDAFFEPGDDLRILAMNWEALQHDRGFQFAEMFCRSALNLAIICDESDSFKNPDSKRCKNLMRLKPHSKYRRIMTGTPVNNSPFDLYSQFNFLDENILGNTSFYAFKAEYAEMLPQDNPLVRKVRERMRGRGNPQLVARRAGKPCYRNLDKLSELIAPHSYRVLKEECVDLPEKIHKTLLFDLSPEQQRVYKKAKSELRLEFMGAESAFDKLVVISKLAQITSGYYLHPESQQPVRIPGKNPKLELLKQRVQKIAEQGAKLIIWARYRAEIEDIADALREMQIEHVEYHGGISADDRKQNIHRFTNGTAQVFVGNQQAGATGITLVEASYVIYFSNNFSLRDRLQSEDRAHRIGQTQNVTYINLAAKGTVDERVIDALVNKKEVADMVIDQGLALFQ